MPELIRYIYTIIFGRQYQPGWMFYIACQRIMEDNEERKGEKVVKILNNYTCDFVENLKFEGTIDECLYRFTTSI